MDTAPPPTGPSAGPDASARPRRSAWRALLLGLIALLVLLALLVAGGWQALRTEAGTRWLLSKVQGLRITEGRGSLSGGPFSAQRVEFELEASPVRVVVEDLAWRDLGWRWRPYPGAYAGLVIEGLQAGRVEIRTRPRPGPASPPPTQLRLPFELHVPDARIARLHIDDHAPLRELHASLHLGTEGGRLHRIERVAFAWDRLQVGGQASLGADAPLPVTLQVQARSAAAAQPDVNPLLGRPWQATLDARGPLQRLEVDARLLPAGPADPTPPTPGTPPARPNGPQARATAVVQPFQPWPLSQLQAQLQSLDLSTLASGAPVTQLSGRAAIDSRGRDRPASVDLALTNDAPGRWDAGRLPVRSLQVDLQARPDRPSDITLRAFDLQLGDGQRPAGRWRGNGRWEDGRLVLSSRLESVQPALLDARAPAWTLQGPVDGHWQRGSGGAWQAAFETRLQGASPQSGLPGMTLQTAGSLSADAGGLVLTLPQWRAESGTARAEGKARLRRGREGDWALQSQGALHQLDPALWWPGEAGSAWRRGPHRLEGRWDADVGGRAGAPPGDGPWPGWRGRVEFTLTDSLLAGVPLAGRVAWQSGGRAGSLSIDLSAGQGNRLRLDGERPAAGADRWRADLDAQALATLAPLFTLAPGVERWAPTAGRLTLRGEAEGQWPRLRWAGEARGSDLKAPVWSAAVASARWRLGGAATEPLEASVQGERLAWGEQRVERLRGDLSGTPAAHQFALQADTAARPPKWTDAFIGARAGRGTVIRAHGQGRWETSAEGARWQGEVQQLRAGAGQAEGGWLQADGVRAALRFDEALALRELQVQPGRLRLLSAALRWDELRWQAAAGDRLPAIQLQATLEPLRVAPLLATLQPDFGWGGDLVVQGRAVLRTGADFQADVVLERVGGDLQVTDEGGTQALGLTDLRLGMVASQGVWHFTQGVAGTQLGVLGGAQSLRVSPRAVWPPAEAPLEGVVELRVDNLGVWGAWIPPGWRLSGQLHTSAQLGGRFGAPEYTGRLEARQLGVRNLLYGVNITEGDVLIALRGESAQIERFLARAGDGVLRLEGGASFGAQPQASLRLNASRFQVLGRVDRRLVASGQAELELAPDTVRLDGRVLVDEGLVDFTRSDAPTLDDDITVVRRPNGRAADAAQAAAGELPSGPVRTPRAVRATLDVNLGERLRIRGRGLDAFLRGQLRLTTPSNRLAVQGTVRTENGTYAAYGQRLVIERGLVTFLGPVENPRLDILALRPNLDVRVGVAVGGTALSPRVRLFSEPEMTEADKLSWLVLGRAPEGLGQADTALLQRAALALLSGEGQGTDRVLQALGIDEFTVRQEGEGDVRNTVVALGKQLSRRWYLGYERGLSSTTGTWQLIYRIAQRFTLRAQAGEDNAVDLIWSWRW